jgi:hypothetical protein
MGCPLFLPSSHFQGCCVADPNTPVPPETVRSCCNPGYARGLCARAAGIEADAFRFLIRKRSFEGIEVAWSIERDHHPVAVGTLLLTEAGATATTPLEYQARFAAMTLLRP